MKILVTGSEGYFGSFLVPHLEEHGDEVVRFDLKDGRDILDAQRVYDHMAGCSAVLHLAAIPHFYPETPEEEYQRVNVLGTKAVLKQFMSRRGMKTFVFMSSGAVYGFGNGARMNGWVEHLPIDEGQMPSVDHPMLDKYGRSKVECERLLDKTGTARSFISLRVNCIDPEHSKGAKEHGDHFGWWTSQELVKRAVYHALYLKDLTSLLRVNVGEPNPNLDPANLEWLVGGPL